MGASKVQAKDFDDSSTGTGDSREQSPFVAPVAWGSDSAPTTPMVGTPDSLTEGEESDYTGTSTPVRTSTTITTRTTGPGTSSSRSMGGPGAGSDVGTTTTIQYSGAARVSPSVSKDGTLTLRPIPSRKDRKVKVKKVISFTPRISPFDRFHPTSQGDAFRGFYVLFWMLMGLTMIRVLYHSYLKSGEVVGMRFAKLISENAIELGISDALLVGSTVICVPFIKLIQHGWIRYHYTGLILQHIGQCLFLGTAIRWTFFRQWYWVQSGFLTLHSLTMLMKVHSYLAFNGAASEKVITLRKTEKELEKAIEDAGGWSQVLHQASQELEATTLGADNDAKANGVRSTALTNGNGTEGGSKPVKSITPTVHRRRSLPAAKEASVIGPSKESRDLLVPEDEDDPKDPRRLVDFTSNEKIWNLANDCVDLQEELTSSGKEGVKWPYNVTYANYIDYLLVPTLVYELEYPRTASVRPIYVLEKTLATFGTFFVIYAITEHVIIPTHESAKANPIRADNFLAAALDLVLPFMINYLLIFYIIFECVCNGFAELTRFADRGFYEDWWNAVTWDEFARKWNKPVHQFLLRHVYASTIAAFRLSKFQATFLTFLLSACVHELVMAIVSKKFRMYLFMMQMAQLPMMALGRLPLLRKNPTLGNIFFWAGLIWGFPLLAVGYLRF